MGLWDSAAKSLPSGVQLGVRSQELEAYREERRQDREQRNKEFEATNARAEAAEARTQEEFDEKKQFKIVKREEPITPAAPTHWHAG